MERTVPSTASEEVELYTRTYYSLLRSSAEVQIRTLEEAHAGMKSLMHLGREMKPRIWQLLYTPYCGCRIVFPRCDWWYWGRAEMYSEAAV